jgi:CSLREA domain-containing protein
MTDRTGSQETKWSTRSMALLVALLMAAMVAALMTSTQAHASAFPGKNGRIVFISERTNGTGVDNPGGDREVFTMNPDGTGLKQLTHNTLEDAVPSYSPDGKKIVFRRQVSASNTEIFVMNADGTGQKNLTNKPADDDNPSFSPGGKKILFDSYRNSNQDIYVMNADGGGQKRLTTDPNSDFDATFSPRGNKIAFERIQFGSPVIFAMNADGTQQTPLTANGARNEGPTFSPDGNRIAFASNRDGGTNIDDYDIFVMSADGSTAPNRLTNSEATEDEPAFSPDGKKIAYTSNRDGGDEDIFVMDSVFGDDVQTNITSTSGAFDFSADWQPLDGNFTVTSASDPGDGLCNADCTLREAITASNGIAGSRMNNIRFGIPGTGVHTITPQTALPRITRPVTIDGYTQPGASPNTLSKGTNAALKIELNGSDMQPTAGLFPNGLSIESSNVVVRGLVVNRFTDQGINVGFDDYTNVTLAGNFVGTDVSGTIALGNGGDGIEMDASNSVVGGTTPAARNLISGNGTDGLSVSGFAKKVRVEGNLVGTRADGVGALGNGFNGVDVAGGSTGVSILGNAIYSNAQLGIDIGVNGRTPNDPGDTDEGANSLQNFPVLTSAKTGTATTITGNLDSTAGKTFKIQFFSNPSGTNEGRTFIGQKFVTTDAKTGNVSFTFSPANKVAAGQTITATATDPEGNTSEFSVPRAVALSTGSDLSPETTKISGPSSLTRSPTAHFRFASPDLESTFECSLDGGAFYSCSSPENIARLSEGRHVFEVRAVDGQGNADPSPAIWIWAVERNG